VFAISRKRGEKKAGQSEDEELDDELPPGFDEEKLERAIEDLATEADSLDEEDPRQMARLMRKLSQSIGFRFGEGMEEAIRRLEAGEDPEQIEQDLGDVLEEEEPVFEGTPPQQRLKRLARRLLPPQVDPTLYDL